MIIGLIGRTIDPQFNVSTQGAGKDTVAAMMREIAGVRRVAFADPLKHFLQRVYGFTDAQLWGASEYRNAPDTRYPREHTWDNNWVCKCCGWAVEASGVIDRLPSGLHPPPCYLTPRYAAQLLGTEWGRHCYEETWFRLGLRDARRELEEGAKAVVFTDVRFRNEADFLLSEGAELVCLTRPTASPITPQTHESETSLIGMLEGRRFTHEICNAGTLPELRTKVAAYLKSLGLYRPMR